MQYLIELFLIFQLVRIDQVTALKFDVTDKLFIKLCYMYFTKFGTLTKNLYSEATKKTAAYFFQSLQQFFSSHSISDDAVWLRDV